MWFYFWGLDSGPLVHVCGAMLFWIPTALQRSLTSGSVTLFSRSLWRFWGSANLRTVPVLLETHWSSDRPALDLCVSSGGVDVLTTLILLTRERRTPFLSFVFEFFHPWLPTSIAETFHPLVKFIPKDFTF